jgi:hypothetical protein
VDAGELSRLQLIIRPGKEGGIITQTEFMFSKFCAEEKLKTKTSEHPGLSVDARELSRLQQLIIRPGEGGGIITQTEFMFPMFCAEEKLKKKTSDRLISMIKRRNFVIEDICAGTIREVETLRKYSRASFNSDDRFRASSSGHPDLVVLPVLQEKCPLPPSLRHDCDCR